MANIVSKEYGFQTNWEDPTGQSQIPIEIITYDDGTQTQLPTGGAPVANNSLAVMGTPAPGYGSSVAYGNGGQGSSGGGSTYGGPGPGYMKPEGWVDPVEVVPEPAQTFAPAGTADYTAQNNLENSLKRAIKPKNIEFGMRMAPQPNVTGPKPQQITGQRQVNPQMQKPAGPKKTFLSSFT